MSDPPNFRETENCTYCFFYKYDYNNLGFPKCKKFHDFEFNDDDPKISICDEFVDIDKYMTFQCPECGYTFYDRVDYMNVKCCLCRKEYVYRRG